MDTTGVVVVALPRAEDYVWQISSEKKPHMTIMFLGERTEGMDITGMFSYLEHAVNTSMCRFGMSVDRRGELGDKPADVLFFKDKYYTEKVETFRNHLLQDPRFFKAYHSAQQFPEWIPHLTLGYPDTPAKPDKRDYPGFHWVEFDRIALWTGDYEGPEILLKELELDLAMKDKGEEFLTHYGVPGMKWGVRRRSRHPGSDDHNNAAAARKKARRHGTKALSNKELKDLVDRMNLEQQYNRLSPPSMLRRGSRFVGEVLAGVGRSQATRIVNDQVTRIATSFRG